MKTTARLVAGLFATVILAGVETTSAPTPADAASHRQKAHDDIRPRARTPKRHANSPARENTPRRGSTGRRRGRGGAWPSMSATWRTTERPLAAALCRCRRVAGTRRRVNSITT